MAAEEPDTVTGPDNFVDPGTGTEPPDGAVEPGTALYLRALGVKMLSRAFI